MNPGNTLQADFSSNPLDAFETLMLRDFSAVAYAMKQPTKTDWNRFGDFLIDKYAIHASSLYHLMKGLIEHRSSKPGERKLGYDLFSINALLRGLIETYTTFNHLFIYPETTSEKHFRFLLWQLDGLLEQKKIVISQTPSQAAERALSENQSQLDSLQNQIESHPFLATLSEDFANKIYDLEKRKVNWKFEHLSAGRIKPLKIIELVKLSCTRNAFVDLYRYTSIHTHSGFIALEHFERVRGKVLSNESTDPTIRETILLTFLLIMDMTSLDKRAKDAFLNVPSEDRNFIEGMAKAIRNDDKGN